jgi:hypothetical protein
MNSLVSWKRKQTMIKHYNETWQFYIRQLQFTSRRGDYMPYFMNTSLYNFIESCDDTILDIGCGENNLKLFYPNIHGVDRTLEADTFAYVDDEEFTNLEESKYGIAVNSLHFGNIHENLEHALSKCDKMWISFNENQPIGEWKNIETWQQYGNVEYFWHGQKEDTRQEIYRHLKDDQLYWYLAELNNRTIEQDVDTVYQNTVQRDPFFGVVRVIIERN